MSESKLLQAHLDRHFGVAKSSRIELGKACDWIKVKAIWHENGKGGMLDFVEGFPANSTNAPLESQFTKAYGRYGNDSVFKTQPLANRSCPYCSMQVVFREKREDNFDQNEGDDELLATLEWCQNCQFWRWHYMTSYFLGRSPCYVIEYTSCASKIGSYNEQLPEGCSIELAKAMRRKPAIFHSVNTTRFERFVADVFRANFGSYSRWSTLRRRERRSSY